MPTSPNIISQSSTQPSNVKPTVKDLSRWADIKDAKDPYTDKGIVVTRVGTTDNQFGNPFIGSKRRDKQGNLVESKVDNITVFNTIDEADQAYRDWLMGTKHQNIKPIRREWILKQINEGKLDGKTLLYYKPMEVENNDGTIVKGGYHSHADTLAEIVGELRGTQPSTSVKLKKIISGGQTGVDRIGLEAGKESGIQTGGTATPGFATENGKDLTLKDFGVEEISKELQAGKSGKEFYLPRTEQNVLNSDGTVYFATDEDSAGRIATERFAKKNNKPFLLNPTAEQLRNWLALNNIETLNVAGNRGSKLSTQKAEEIKNIIKQALSQPTQSTNVKPTIDSSTKINIYDGTGENADLSNFATRPFKFVVQPIVSAIYGEKSFDSVEQAFQWHKGLFAEAPAQFGGSGSKTVQLMRQIKETKNGAEIKKLGQQFNLIKSKQWDSFSSVLMKDLLKESFQQNPEALKKLLATGNAELTHTQDTTKWGKEFPKLLMEVREELRPTQAVNTESNVNEEKTDSGKTISELGMSQEEWNKLTIEEKNKIKSCN